MSSDLMFGYDYDMCSPEAPCKGCRERVAAASLGETVVLDHMPAPGLLTVSCEAVPMPIQPDPRDARIAELGREVARLEALIVRTVEDATGIDADLHMEADRIRDRVVGSRMSDPREKE